MNHIAWLQGQLTAAQTSAAATAEAVQEFRGHLASGKFAGTDADGSRRDWIATADITAWLARITAAGG